MTSSPTVRERRTSSLLLSPEHVRFCASPAKWPERRGTRARDETDVDHRVVLWVQPTHRVEEHRHVVREERVRLFLAVRLGVGRVEVLDVLGGEVREPGLASRRLHDEPQHGQPAVGGRGRVVARADERPHALTPRFNVGDIELVDEELAERRHETGRSFCPPCRHVSRPFALRTSPVFIFQLE
jgi:hypothetical protein